MTEFKGEYIVILEKDSKFECDEGEYSKIYKDEGKSYKLCHFADGYYLPQDLKIYKIKKKMNQEYQDLDNDNLLTFLEGYYSNSKSVKNTLVNIYLNKLVGESMDKYPEFADIVAEFNYNIYLNTISDKIMRVQDGFTYSNDYRQVFGKVEAYQTLFFNFEFNKNNIEKQKTYRKYLFENQPDMKKTYILYDKIIKKYNEIILNYKQNERSFMRTILESKRKISGYQKSSDSAKRNKTTINAQITNFSKNKIIYEQQIPQNEKSIEEKNKQKKAHETAFKEINKKDLELKKTSKALQTDIKSKETNKPKLEDIKSKPIYKQQIELIDSKKDERSAKNLKQTEAQNSITTIKKLIISKLLEQKELESKKNKLDNATERLPPKHLELVVKIKTKNKLSFDNFSKRHRLNISPITQEKKSINKYIKLYLQTTKIINKHNEIQQTIQTNKKNELIEKQKIEKLGAEIKILDTVIPQLEKKLELDVQTEYLEYLKNIENLKKENEKNQQMLAKYKQEMDDIQLKFDNLNRRIEELRLDNKTYKGKIDNIPSQITKLTQENSKNIKEIEKCDNKILEESANLKSLETKYQNPKIYIYPEYYIFVYAYHVRDAKDLSEETITEYLRYLSNISKYVYQSLLMDLKNTTDKLKTKIEDDKYNLFIRRFESSITFKGDATLKGEHNYKVFIERINDVYKKQSIIDIQKIIDHVLKNINTQIYADFSTGSILKKEYKDNKHNYSRFIPENMSKVNLSLNMFNYIAKP